MPPMPAGMSTPSPQAIKDSQEALLVSIAQSFSLICIMLDKIKTIYFCLGLS